MFSIADSQAEEDMSELESDSESDVEDSPAPFPVRAALSITKVLISSLFSYLITPMNINSRHSWYQYSLLAQERLTST
jgi:hypothetical protein